MKKIYILLAALFIATACDSDLDQSPPNLASADSLTDFEGVLNAAYYYQLGSVTPLAVMGEFRSDNAVMDEAPYTEFDAFTANLTTMEDQFFGPLYTAMYKSILSSNNVIQNSSDATEVAEAKFLRALSYYKLVKSFGAVTVNLEASPSLTDTSILARVPAMDVYNNVVIPDLNDAMSVLSTTISNGRASKYAAQALLGKVYAAMGDYASAASNLGAVVNGASAAGITLQANFSDIFGFANEGNSEIIYATQISSSIVDEYGFGSDFWNWFVGDDSKSDFPVDSDLVAAFDASDMGTANSAAADLYPQDSFAYTGFSTDYNFSRFSYERFFPNMDQNSILTKWRQDQANLVALMNTRSNFGYIIPWNRPINDSHCSRVSHTETFACTTSS